MLPSTRFCLVAAVAGMAASPMPASAQDALQLNVPYRCQDGVTRTITRCERNARAEVCFWKEEEKGQVTERYNVRSQMDGWMRTCTVAAAQPAAAAPPRPAASSPPPQPLNSPSRAPTPPPGAGATVDRRNDPTAIATRRCLESGGSELECLGKGLANGLLGTDSILPKSTTRGLRLGGEFKTAAGTVLTFDNENANIQACGALEGQSVGYSVTRRGAQLQVELETNPTPLAVGLGPDGKLTGPAAFDLSGDVIVGYQTNWVETRTSDNVVVPGSGHQERVPVRERRIARCAFPSLTPTGPTKAEVSVLGLVPGLLGGPADQAAQKPPSEAPAGARFAGTYAGPGGVRFEFHSTAVVVDCGQVHTTVSYAVRNAADRALIVVANGNVPVSLALAPDGTLTGSGNIDVTGRVVTGASDRVNFATRTARCALTTLAPQ